jgi:2-amino-4-hydroxy-6-hydroxymethyldihydropteridine diphosphokinase
MPVQAAVGLGGNVGDAISTVRLAMQALAEIPGSQLIRSSRLYRTPAWGVRDQADFVNAVALLETSLTARDLLDALLAVERRFGRERRERWGPRILDLDLLLYADEMLDVPGLHVPHPHLHERAFALLPLLEIAPDARIPGRGPAREALSALACEGIEAVG